MILLSLGVFPGDPVKYGWEAHDGRSFGRQKITDGDLLSFFIDWISKGEKSWTVRMFGRAEQNSSFSFLLYLALQVLKFFFIKLSKFFRKILAIMVKLKTEC